MVRDKVSFSWHFRNKTLPHMIAESLFWYLGKIRSSCSVCWWCHFCLRNAIKSWLFRKVAYNLEAHTLMALLKLQKPFKNLNVPVCRRLFSLQRILLSSLRSFLLFLPLLLSFHRSFFLHLLYLFLPVCPHSFPHPVFCPRLFLQLFLQISHLPLFLPFPLQFPLSLSSHLLLPRIYLLP